MEGKRVLILASVASMIDQFNMPNIKLLSDLGYEVHVACNFIEGNTCSDEQIKILKNNLFVLGAKFYQVDFKRNVMRLADNIKAYKQVYKLASENNYKFLHCHSPIGGVVGRLIGKVTKTKVIYTAHGFHFHKGAPLKNWLIYYPVEKWLSRYTDVLITINKEDYERAKWKFKAKRVEYIPGVGLDIDEFRNVVVDKIAMREEIGVPQDGFVVFSVGELNKNKNHEVIIRAIAKINNPKIYYIICGQGQLDGYLRNLSKELGIDKQVHLLGFRKDIPEICKVSDIFAFPSFREGLGMAALEAMACGLPIITSNVHGIVDYSIGGKTGYNCKPSDVDSFSRYIRILYTDAGKRKEMALNNIEIVKRFNLSNVLNLIGHIYLKY